METSESIKNKLNELENLKNSKTETLKENANEISEIYTYFNIHGEFKNPEDNERFNQLNTTNARLRNEIKEYEKEISELITKLENLENGENLEDPLIDFDDDDPEDNIDDPEDNIDDPEDNIDNEPEDSIDDTEDNIDDTEDNIDDPEDDVDDDELVENIDDYSHEEEINFDKEYNELMEILKNRLDSFKNEKKELQNKQKNETITIKEDRRLENVIDRDIEEVKVEIKALKKSNAGNFNRIKTLIVSINKYTDDINAILSKNKPTEVEKNEYSRLKSFRTACRNELDKVALEKNNKDHKILKVTAGVLATVIGVSIIGSLVGTAINNSKKSKNNNNSNNNNNSYSNGTIDTPNVPDLPVQFNDQSETLKQIGYSDQVISLILQSGNPEIIATLCNYGYPIDNIEFYLKAKYFDPARIVDYEDVRNRYNLSGESAVDIVTRAINLYSVGYFNNSNNDLSELYEILIAIEDQNIFFEENRELHNALVQELFQICNDVMNDEFTIEDLNKVAYIPYFAKEGSDLANNLYQAAPLWIECFQNPSNTENNDKLYKHYLITTYGYGGTITDKSLLTDDPVFNENAILDNSYDYYISSNVFQFGLQSGATAHMDYDKDREKIERWSNLEKVQNDLFYSSNYCSQSESKSR